MWVSLFQHDPQSSDLFTPVFLGFVIISNIYYVPQIHALNVVNQYMVKRNTLNGIWERIPKCNLDYALAEEFGKWIKVPNNNTVLMK